MVAGIESGFTGTESGFTSTSTCAGGVTVSLHILTLSRNASARSCTVTSSLAVLSVTMPRSRSAFFTAFV